MRATPDPNWTFSELLDWHVKRGTRIDGSPQSVGVPWEAKEFARAVGKASSEGEKTDRTIRNWRNGETLPGSADLHGVLQALFGAKSQFAEWQSDLSEKYHAALSNEPDESEAAAIELRNISIPARPLRCLGRDEDLKAVVEAMTADSDRIAVLVLGGPGMGKTTLTRQAANDDAAIARFGQRRWFVELETATTAEALEKAIIAALGLDPATSKFADALTRLAQVAGVLLLDNLETPWDAEREKVETVLAALHRVPGVVLLASIRGNEPPAGLRWSRQRTMHPLEPPHDRDLFLDIAQDIKPDDSDLAPLLADLGGVPLAIELVAMQAAPGDTLEAIHDQWQRVGTALAQRRGVAASRLTSLERSLELSFDSPRLGDPGRRMFALLGQLPAGLCGEDLAALLGEAAFDARQGLLASGLGHERDGRLDLLPPVRDHARRLHAPSDDEATRWVTHFLSVARTLGSRISGTEGRVAVQRIAAELPNLDPAVRSAGAVGALQLAISALSAIENTMTLTGLGTTAMLSNLADACRIANDAKSEAIAIDATGHIALARSDHDAARKAHEQALPLHRQVGSILGEANCIKSLGNIALARSDHDAARAAYEQALPLYRQVGSILGEANCIKSLGDIALRRSDHDAARAAYEQALPLYRQVGEIMGEANCIKRLGHIALERSDHDAARKACEQALPLYRQVGDILGEANCITSLGDIALRRSDHDAARKACEQALPLYRQVGDILGEANCIKSLGDIALERSDPDAARKAYEQALSLYERIADPYSIGGALAMLACVTRGNDRAGHLAAARAAWTSIDRPDLVEMLDEEQEAG